LAGVIGYHLFPSNIATSGAANDERKLVSSPVEPSVKAIQQAQDNQEVASKPDDEKQTEIEPEPEPVKPDPLRYVTFQTLDGTGSAFHLKHHFQ